MAKATKLYRSRIALIFDFDDTLGPSTFHTLLDELGYDPDKFEAEKVKPLVSDGWDTVLARYHGLIELSHQREQPITLDQIEAVGQDFDLFKGVEGMFDQVEGWANEFDLDVEVEFYMLTAGMAEIPKSTPIADRFDQIWAGACAFNDKNELTFVKRIITHPEKTRYLIQLAKGFHHEGNPQPAEIHEQIPQEEYYIPYDQMIYVGDGASDMPAFEFIEEKGGIAIGVVVEDNIREWRGYDDVDSDRQVQNIAKADYSEGSQLMKSLQHATYSIIQKIALRQMGEGE